MISMLFYCDELKIYQRLCLVHLCQIIIGCYLPLHDTYRQVYPVKYMTITENLTECVREKTLVDPVSIYRVKDSGKQSILLDED